MTSSGKVRLKDSYADLHACDPMWVFLLLADGSADGDLKVDCAEDDIGRGPISPEVSPVQACWREKDEKSGSIVQKSLSYLNNRGEESAGLKVVRKLEIDIA